MNRKLSIGGRRTAGMSEGVLAKFKQKSLQEVEAGSDEPTDKLFMSTGKVLQILESV